MSGVNDQISFIFTLYPRLILKNGPTVKNSAMKFESKYKEVKYITPSTSSKGEIDRTVSKRYLLSLIHHKFGKYEERVILFG